ncbi:MAG: 1-acyl-sn-glycerol-3-phosphate acyltransferase [Desulfobacterales bacterium]|nr:1-acyl-sn-glycerol-3-phosphate acyltransferase [Desulfobacterales bacterium]
MLSTMIKRLMKGNEGIVPEDIHRRVETLKNTCNSWGYNEWGYSLDWIKRYMTIGQWLNTHYFRLQPFGLEHIPEGQFMLIGNHSSQMAYDGMIITTAVFNNTNPPRFVQAMIGTFFAYQPLYSVLMPRIGQISGTPENCQRLLEEGKAVLVFPEGEKGGGKTFFNRYKLMKFGEGFMQLAQLTKTPIIPFAFIGGEEMVPSFSRMEFLGKMIGMPYFPLSPTLIFPLPTKCSLYFGKPILFEDDPMDQKAISTNVDKVRTVIQQLIQQGLQARKSIFF